MAGRRKEVAEGTRAPELRNLEEKQASGPERPLEQVTKKAGVTVFRTGAPRYTITITVPDDTRKRGKSITLSAFKDVETADKEIIEALLAHPRCGYGNLFWTAEQEEAAAQVSAQEQLLSAAKMLAAHDPGAVRKVLADLGLASFPLGDVSKA
jgi:hypothetical protein